MDSLAQSIATNYYLQAIAIAASIGSALYAIYSVRLVAIGLLKSASSAIFSKIWTPNEKLSNESKMGSKNPSYLVAVILRNFIYIALVIYLIYTLNILDSLITNLSKNQLLLMSVRFLRTTLFLVAGIRVGELLVITKKVIREVEDES